MHFAWSVLAIFSFYYLLSSIVSRNAAFWGALLLGLDPWFMYSMGQDYPAGISISYGLASGALLVWAVKSRRWVLPMIMSGMVFACSVHAHSFGLIYLPILFLVALYHNGANHQRSNWLGTALFSGGMFLGSAAFALIYYRVSGGENLYQVIWNAIQKTVVEAPKNQFGEALSLSAVPETFWVHIGAAVWLLCAILLFSPRGKVSGPAAYWSHPASRPYGFCLTLCFVFGLIILTLDYGFGINLLSFNFYFSFGLPLAYLGVAGIIERAGGISEKHHKMAAAGFLVALTLLSFQTFHYSLMELPFNYLWMVGVLWVACLGLLLQWPDLREKGYGRAVAVALLAFAGYFLTGHDNPVWNWKEFSRAEPQATSRYFFEKINEGTELIEAQAPDAWFWFSREDPNHMLYISLASLQLWQNRLISDRLPSIVFSREMLGKTIVALSVFADEFEDRVVPVLKEKGLRHQLLSQKQMVYQGRPVYMTFMRLVDWGLPTETLADPATLWQEEGESLRKALQKNVYGTIKREDVLKSQGRSLVFNPGSERDHLATPFFKTVASGLGKEYWIRVSLSFAPDSRPASSCVFFIQNRKFKRLHQSPCANPYLEKPDALEERHFRVSGEDDQLRLVFMSQATTAPTHIPVSIRIERLEKVPG